MATVLIELEFDSVPTEAEIYNYLEELMDSDSLGYYIDRGISDANS